MQSPCSHRSGSLAWTCAVLACALWSTDFTTADERTPPSAPAEAAKGGDENFEAREFYGLTVSSRRIIFVLDHSKSMLSQLGGQTRLERLRDEMDKFFENPDASRYFDIHCFNDRLVTYRRKLVHNDEGTVTHAREFLLEQPARGKTATFDALKSALIEGQDEAADRIIFVTDGHPTTGSIVEPSAILAALRRINAHSRIPIDVLAYDTSRYPVRRGFLQQLAYEHGGKFVPLD